MAYHRTGPKFGLTTGKRTALLRGLAIAFITHGKIQTTETRARAIRQLVEKMVTKARKNDVASRRIVLARLGNNRAITTKLFTEIAPKYLDRKGGYTRIIKLPLTNGKNDGRRESIIEFV